MVPLWHFDLLMDTLGRGCASNVGHSLGYFDLCDVGSDGEPQIPSTLLRGEPHPTVPVSLSRGVQ
jgi:hypothetical protein